MKRREARLCLVLYDFESAKLFEHIDVTVKYIFDYRFIKYEYPLVLNLSVTPVVKEKILC